MTNRRAIKEGSKVINRDWVYRRRFDIVSKYNVRLKTLLLGGLSEPEFYGDLVYKLKK